MDFQFNPAQLSRSQQNSLMDVLGVMQAENTNELVVTPVEFPIKLKVKLDDDIEMLLGWDVDKQSYAGLTTPEITQPNDDPRQYGGETLPSKEDVENESAEDAKPEPEPELDLSPVVVRVEALARALVKLVKPFDIDRRVELWMKFCIVLFKELME